MTREEWLEDFATGAARQGTWVLRGHRLRQVPSPPWDVVDCCPLAATWHWGHPREAAPSNAWVSLLAHYDRPGGLSTRDIEAIIVAADYAVLPPSADLVALRAAMLAACGLCEVAHP